MNLQHLIDAGAAILAFPLWPWLIALTWFVLLIGRATFVRWMEALGWDGLRELLAGFGNSPSSLIRAQEQAREGAPGNVTSLPRQ